MAERPQQNEIWRDERGDVLIDGVVGPMPGIQQSLGVYMVLYRRQIIGGQTVRLGLRRFLRDFQRKPLVEATEDHPAICREGSRLVFQRKHSNYGDKNG